MATLDILGLSELGGCSRENLYHFSMTKEKMKNDLPKSLIELLEFSVLLVSLL